MARRKFSGVEREIMRGIAENLRKILKERDWSQKDLADNSKLSTSVVSDYLNEKTLATPGSVQMMADALKISKGDIDPTFKSEQSVKNDAKIQFFMELEKDLGLDLTDPNTQEMLKRAAKILFSSKE